MKRLNRFIIASLVALCIISCGTDETNFNTGDNVVNPGDIIDPTSQGYLDLSGSTFIVDVEEEFFTDSKASDTNLEADDSYIITVSKEDSNGTAGEEIYRSTYAEAKDLTDPLTLSAGAYIVTAMSTADEPTVGWESPYYAGSQRLIVGDEKITEVGEVICYLSNIKISVIMSADLKDLFKADEDLDTDEIPLEITVELDDASLTFDREESRYGYFKAISESNTLDVSLMGMYNTAAAGETPSYSKIDKGGWSQSISGVKAGQARQISVKIDNYSDGVLQIRLEIQSWSYSDGLDVDIMSKAFYVAYEEEIFDPDNETSDLYSPEVTLANNLDIDASYSVGAGIFDTDAEVYSPVHKTTITPQNGSTIKSIDLYFSSTNDDFMDALTAAGYKGGNVPLWSNSTANEALAEYVTIRLGDDEEIISTIKYLGMRALYSFIGTHEAKVVAVDSEDRISYTTLSFNVLADGGPSVIWRSVDGYMEDVSDYLTVRHEITTDSENPLPIILDIVSKSGIETLTLRINSDVLNATELATVGLAQEMDLINPETDDMAEKLSDLGLPVGESIKGSTELVFNITDFMPMLAAISPNGSQSDFEITVSDASGTTIKTVMVEVVK